MTTKTWMGGAMTASSEVDEGDPCPMEGCEGKDDEYVSSYNHAQL